MKKGQQKTICHPAAWRCSSGTSVWLDLPTARTCSPGFTHCLLSPARSSVVQPRLVSCLKALDGAGPARPNGSVSPSPAADHISPPVLCPGQQLACPAPSPSSALTPSDLCCPPGKHMVAPQCLLEVPTLQLRASQGLRVCSAGDVEGSPWGPSSGPRGQFLPNFLLMLSPWQVP